MESGEGRPERAARLLGAAAALRLAIGYPPDPVSRAANDRTAAAARAALGRPAAAAATATGRALPLEQAVAAALEAEPSPPGATGAPSAAPATRPRRSAGPSEPVKGFETRRPRNY